MRIAGVYLDQLALDCSLLLQRVPLPETDYFRLQLGVLSLNVRWLAGLDLPDPK